MATTRGSPGQLRLTSIPVNYSLETLHPRRRKSYEKVPRSMKSNFYLTHPDLSRGQKRYLWSICSIYSTSQMKQLIQDQFIRQLFYEMSKGIIRTADWNKYLQYLLDPKKRKYQFQTLSPKVWKAPADQFKFRYFRDHPVDLPQPPLPSFVDDEINHWTKLPVPSPPKSSNYVTKQRRSGYQPLSTINSPANRISLPNAEKEKLLATLGSTSGSSSPSYSFTFTSSGSNGSSNAASDENQKVEKTVREGLTRPKSRFGRRILPINFFQ